MAELLVSVRSVEEAAAALAGGAAIIDVKEPARGSLGRADDPIIAEVLRFVAERRPVSAALGELIDELPPFPGSGLSFVKWGLAGCQRRQDWHKRLQVMRRHTSSKVVFVAYADWQCAQAPRVEEVAELACQEPGNVLLVDTHCKDAASLKKDRRPTLLDWMSREEVNALSQRCRRAGVKVALAGSLGEEEIRQLRQADPAWFAVRGAVCAGSERQGQVQEHLVRQLTAMLASPEYVHSG